MSLYSAFYGAAFKDAEIKASKGGNKYATALMSVANGTDDDAEAWRSLLL